MSQFGGAVSLCSIYKSKHSHRYRLYSIGISSQLSTYLRSFSVVEIPWQRTNGFFHQKTAPLLRSAHRWNSSVEKVERISSWQSKFQVFSAAKPTFESTAVANVIPVGIWMGGIAPVFHSLMGSQSSWEWEIVTNSLRTGKTHVFP